MRHLADRPDIVPSDSLSPALREAVETFAADRGPDALPPLVVGNACGCYRIEVLTPGASVAFYGMHARARIVDAGGREMEMDSYHRASWERYLLRACFASSSSICSNLSAAMVR